MFQVLKGLFGRHPEAKAARRARPGVEALEDRLVLSTTFAQLPIMSTDLGGFGTTVARSDSGTVVRISEGSNDLRYTLYNSSGYQWATGLVPGFDPTRDSQPTLAMGNNGRFVVAWSHVWSYTPYDVDVHAQVFDANGNAIGGTLWVAASGNVEDSPSAGMDQYGNFVVAYRYSPAGASQIYAKTYTASGQLIGTAAVATSSDDQENPSVAMNRYGQFVVAFNDNTSGGSYSVGLRTFNLYDQQLGSTRIYGAFAPSAAIDANGDVGIAYTYLASGYQQIGVERFAVSGQYEGFTHVGSAGEFQFAPSIGMADDGRFVVAYEDFSSSQTSLYVEEFSAAGTEVGLSYFGGSTGASSVSSPTVAMDAAGDFAINCLVSGSDHSYEYATLNHF
jgi:hypothetical protein